MRDATIKISSTDVRRVSQLVFVLSLQAHWFMLMHTCVSTGSSILRRDKLRLRSCLNPDLRELAVNPGR